MILYRLSPKSFRYTLVWCRRLN